MRTLRLDEKHNEAFILGCAGNGVLVHLTPTGYRKGIMDAIEPLRSLLRVRGLHNFNNQPQGEENKSFLVTEIITDEGTRKTTVSLYRPKTKKGDPRIWPSGLKNFASGDDVLIFFVFDDRLHLLNLTKAKRLTTKSPVGLLFGDMRRIRENIAKQLLLRLRISAKRGWIPAVGSGS